MTNFSQFLFLVSIISFSFCLDTATCHLNHSVPLEPGVSSWTNSDASLPTSTIFSDGSMARFILIRERQPVMISTSTVYLGLGFGFYCTSPSSHDRDTCYIAVLFVEMSEGSYRPEAPQVVWLANRDSPVGEDATLSFTVSGDLALFDAKKNKKVWSTYTSKVSVSQMSIAENGNFVLFGPNGEMAWQSFEHLTHTLVEGQKIIKGHRLISSLDGSKTVSSGLFFLGINSSSLSGYVEPLQGDQRPVRYFAIDFSRFSPLQEISVPITPGFNILVRLNWVEFQKGKLSFNLDLFLGGPGRPFTVVKDTNTSKSVQILRLDSDGGIRIYGWEAGEKWQEITIIGDEFNGECRFPLRCGRYGLCSEGGKKCSCPVGVDGIPYFEPVNSSELSLGCSPVRGYSLEGSRGQYKLVNFGDLSNYRYFDQEQAFPGLEDEDSCVEACRKDEFCRAAFFECDKSSKKCFCFLAAEVLSLMETPEFSNFNSSSHLKILLLDQNKP